MQALWLFRNNNATAGPAPEVSAPESSGLWAALQFQAVACSEAPHADTRTLELAAIAGAARSGPFSAAWSWGPGIGSAPCAVWGTSAQRPYLGPWGRPTASTVLVIGNMYDPATPFQGSEAVAVDVLSNAVLLATNGTAHGMSGLDSSCAWRHWESYMLGGQLPPQGTLCTDPVVAFSVPAGVEREEGQEVVSRRRELLHTPQHHRRLLAA